MKLSAIHILWLFIWLSIPAWSQPRAMLPYAGRWDLTISTPNGSYPSWMEVSQKDVEAVVVLVGSEGGLHGSANVKLEPQEINTNPALNAGAVVMGEKTLLMRLSFTTLEKFGGKNVPVLWELDSAGGKIAGRQKRGDGVTASIAGEHAPPLKRKTPSKWSAPEALLTGGNLAGWKPIHLADNHWSLKDGVLSNESPGADLETTKTFQDFRLHVEYNCAAKCNSGIFLRGRYELQIEYGDSANPSPSSVMGSIYGYLAPAAVVEPKPGTWESFDVTLVGRSVTVLRNGVLIIDNKQIPGITGGALNSNEAQPGPLYLQGDVSGGVQFRNLTVAEPVN